MKRGAWRRITRTSTTLLFKHFIIIGGVREISLQERTRKEILTDNPRINTYQATYQRVDPSEIDRSPESFPGGSSSSTLRSSSGKYRWDNFIKDIEWSKSNVNDHTVAGWGGWDIPIYLSSLLMTVLSLKCI